MTSVNGSQINSINPIQQNTGDTIATDDTPAAWHSPNSRRRILSYCRFFAWEFPHAHTHSSLGFSFGRNRAFSYMFWTFCCFYGYTLLIRLLIVAFAWSKTIKIDKSELFCSRRAWTLNCVVAFHCARPKMYTEICELTFFASGVRLFSDYGTWYNLCAFCTERNAERNRILSPWLVLLFCVKFISAFNQVSSTFRLSAVFSSLRFLFRFTVCPTNDTPQAAHTHGLLTSHTLNPFVFSSHQLPNFVGRMKTHSIFCLHSKIESFFSH